MPQTYSNHSRYIPLWHFITGTLVIALPGGAIVNLFHSTPDTHYANALIVVISLVLMLMFWYARWFALRAQDRAIRAEENLRHFALTGKLLDKKLRTSQVIALRFASDEEFVALAQKAAAENLSPKQIKQAVKEWKADYHRV
jgi:cbb3-type cytochrome oxidase subunit 3